jgi:NADH dehydrogenase
MDISSVCIVGGSGFVGRAVADHAYHRGLRVRVLTRYAPKAANLTVVPTAEIATANPHDEHALAEAFDDMDAVVNLVGILHPSRRGGFEAVHAELPRKIAHACHAAGVRHLVHMSALGAAADGPSEYLRSKARGEAAVRDSAGILPWTVFRPSVIFGDGDRFLNLFARLARLFPAMPLACPKARFAPVWVEDVARCFVAALGDPRTFGQAYELCGPKAYALEDLVRLAMEITGHRRPIVPLPPALAALQAWVFEHLPGRLITRDNLRSMSVDNVCAGPFPAIFGFEPAPLEAVAPQYLVWDTQTTRGRYARFRHHAGR